VGPERKGFDAFEVDSFKRLAITSNNVWAVPASAGERRYAVFNCGPRREDDYYKALAEERENGGPAALLAYLQGVNLSGFNVRRAPETDGLNDQKLESLEGIPAWWREKLESGCPPNINLTGQVLKEDNEWEFYPLEIEVENLRQDYADWNHGRRGAGNPPGPEGFGK
jgi:hypothetical protein